MPLTDLKLRQLKPAAAPFRQSDGGGLFIEVRPGGSRLWRLAYRFGGKQKLLALGSYPETPLARARQLRQDARSQLQAGRDPAAEAKAAAEAERALTKDTFAALADELLAKQEREGKAAATLDKKRWLIGLRAPRSMLFDDATPQTGRRGAVRFPSSRPRGDRQVSENLASLIGSSRMGSTSPCASAL